MRAHLFLSALAVATLVGGVALAERPEQDHSLKEKPRKEHNLRERNNNVREIKAPLPERLERLRAYGEVDRVAKPGAGASQKSQNDKAKAQLEQRVNDKLAARRNCSNVGDECNVSSRPGKDTSASSRDGSSKGTWLSRERDRLREEYIRAMMDKYMNKALKKEGK